VKLTEMARNYVHWESYVMTHMILRVPQVQRFLIQYLSIYQFFMKYSVLLTTYD